MYFWNSYPFVRFTIAIILGIVCFDQYPELWNRPLIVLTSGVSLAGILIYLSHKISFYTLRHLNGVIALSLIFFIGGYFTKNIYHTPSESHYLNLKSKIVAFSGTIVSPVTERTNHFRYIFELESIVFTSLSTQKATGKIHLYIRKDTTESLFRYGDQLTVYGQFHTVPNPDNPNEFNYKLYLQRQNIYSHAFVHTEDILCTGNNPSNPFLKWAYSLRLHASEIIDKNITQSRENGIAKALLLGIKDHLDNEVKASYSSAGAMHVLAVSGLHVGIIYLLIRLFFSKLKQTGKWGRYLFGIISVLIIWLYATVTGLSPSVLRAATMFSLVAISQASTREGNIYNTLGFAAFILLIFDPYLIYSVGFQLSFAAVMGIVYLQPKLYRLAHFNTLITDKAWAITCVSITAQLATFPLSTYYFHQFPTYFLVSNLIVIPASFLMLIGGISMLLIEPIFASAGKIIGIVLEQFMWIINELMSYVHVLPKSLIEWIYMDQFGLFVTYAILGTVISGLHYRSFKTLIVSAFLGIAAIGWNMISHEKQSKRNELIFYEVSDKTAIDHICGHQAILYLDKINQDDLELLAFQINPHRLSSHLSPIDQSVKTLKGEGFQKKNTITQGQIADKKIILLDSTTFHLNFKQVIHSDFIIINHRAVKSLSWLKKHFTFDRLVIGNKNSLYYSRKMKKQANKLGIHLHSLKEDGALRILL